jgi:hypothetical protein
VALIFSGVALMSSTFMELSQLGASSLFGCLVDDLISLLVEGRVIELD